MKTAHGLLSTGNVVATRRFSASTVSCIFQCQRRSSVANCCLRIVLLPYLFVRQSLRLRNLLRPCSPFVRIMHNQGTFRLFLACLLFACMSLLAIRSFIDDYSSHQLSLKQSYTRNLQLVTASVSKIVNSEPQTKRKWTASCAACCRGVQPSWQLSTLTI
jgi:hypothetical protein